MKNSATKRIFVNTNGKNVFIAREELFNVHGQKLTVIFLPWHAGVVPFSWLIHRLVHKHESVAVYYFAEEILSADAEAVRDFYGYIKQEIPARLSELQTEFGFTSVRFIGMSLGNVALGVVAKAWQGFTSAVQVCTATSLSRSVWEGDRTKDIRYIFEENSCSLKDLEAMWQDIEPVNNLSAFSHKPLTIVVSKSDTTIPAHLQWNYVQYAKELGLKPKVKTTKLSHYGAIIAFCLWGTI